MNNPATSLPPKIRAIIYWANFVLGLILGSMSIWFLTTTGGQPVWLQGIVAVGAFLSAGFGAMAGSNVNRKIEEAESVSEPELNH